MLSEVKEILFSGVQEWLLFDVVTPHTDIVLWWSVPPVVVWRSIHAVPKPNITKKLGKDSLVTDQDGYHFVVSDNLPTVLFTWSWH